MRGDLSIDKELEVLAKWKLDANSWYLIRMLFIAKYENDLSYLFKYITECNAKDSLKESLQVLKEKGILDKKYVIPEKGQAFEIKDLLFNESFIKKYFKTSQEGGRELFDAYPKWLVMGDGTHLPARNITSKVVFKSLDAFFQFYGKSIKYDLQLHQNVLKGLEFAKQNNLVKSPIVEFVIGEKYNDYLEAMNNDEDGKFNQKFNTIDFE